MALDDAAVGQFDENVAGCVGAAAQHFEAPVESVEIPDGGGGPVDGHLVWLAGADGGGEVPQANGLVIHGGDPVAAAHDNDAVGGRFESSADDGGLAAHGTAKDGDPGKAGEGEKSDEGEGGEGASQRPPGGGAENPDVGGEAEEKAERRPACRIRPLRSGRRR